MLPYITDGLPEHISAVLKMRIYSKAVRISLASQPFLT